MKSEVLNLQIERDLMGGSVVRTEPLLLRVSEVATLLGIGRTKAYEMATSGELPVVRIGTAVRVPRRELEAWVAARVVKAA